MDDWDTVTKIGKSVNRGGSGPRETVIRGKSALNAAQRSGAVVATEKKYTTGNLSTKGGPDGQRLAKIDRTNDTGKIEKLSQEVRDAMKNGRLAAKEADGKSMSQAGLARRIFVAPAEIQAYEAGTLMPSQQILAKIENVLNVKLRGTEIGKPKFVRKK